MKQVGPETEDTTLALLRMDSKRVRQSGNLISRLRRANHAESDIDLAVFWDRDDIDGFDEDVLLRKLCWDIDLRIEPHSFARSDFDETDPYIREIIETGERIL